MKTLDDLKRETHENFTQYRHYVDSGDFARSVVDKTIDYLHSRGYLGGVPRGNAMIAVAMKGKKND